MLELRQRVNDSGSIKISVNDFVVKAYAQALMAFPADKAAWAEDRKLGVASADIDVPDAVEGGLFTPVVRSANSKGLPASAADIRDIADRQRTRNKNGRATFREYVGRSV